MTTHVVSVRMDEELKRRIERLARKERRSRAAVMAMLLEWAIERAEEPAAATRPLAASGQERKAAEIDDAAWRRP